MRQEQKTEKQIMRIKSVLEADKYGYSYAKDSMENWSRRGNHDLLNALTKHHTYGDGDTQHSGAWCVQVADATDALLSLASAILGDPSNEIWQGLQWQLNPVCKKSIEFAFSVKFKEGKTQYFSRDLLKVTSSDKQHDKRYERINQYQDGTFNGAMSVLVQSHWDFVQWMACMEACMDYAVEHQLGYPMREDIDPILGKISGDWHQAFRALQQSVIAVVALTYAQRICESCEGNSRRSAQAAQAAQAA